MEMIRLGGSGPEVSRLALGTWQFGGSWGEVGEREAAATVDRALDLGFRFFDTAHAYGFGRAEEVLGRALANNGTFGRDDVVIATKGGVRKGEDGNERDSSPAFLRVGLETSLRALGTDHVDIFLLHWPDDGVPLEDIAAQLQAFRDEGKVRHLGVSNFDATRLDALRKLIEVDVVQPPYSLLRRGVEAELLPYAEQHDIGVFVYGALAHGLLTGRFAPGTTFGPGDWRAGSPVFQGQAFERNAAVAQRLVDLAEEYALTPTQLAIAWTLHRQEVHSAIVGGRAPEQIEDAAGASQVRFDADQVAAIEAAAADSVPVGGPSPEGGVDT